MTYVNGKSVLAIGILSIILGTAAVSARFFLRRHRKSGLGVDDWLCVPALVGHWPSHLESSVDN